MRDFAWVVFTLLVGFSLNQLATKSSYRWGRGAIVLAALVLYGLLASSVALEPFWLLATASVAGAALVLIVAAAITFAGWLMVSWVLRWDAANDPSAIPELSATIEYGRSFSPIRHLYDSEDRRKKYWGVRAKLAIDLSNHSELPTTIDDVWVEIPGAEPDADGELKAPLAIRGRIIPAHGMSVFAIEYSRNFRPAMLHPRYLLLCVRASGFRTVRFRMDYRRLRSTDIKHTGRALLPVDSVSNA